MPFSHIFQKKNKASERKPKHSDQVEQPRNTKQFRQTVEGILKKLQRTQDNERAQQIFSELLQQEEVEIMRYVLMSALYEGHETEIPYGDDVAMKLDLIRKHQVVIGGITIINQTPLNLGENDMNEVPLEEPAYEMCFVNHGNINVDIHLQNEVDERQMNENDQTEQSQTQPQRQRNATGKLPWWKKTWIWIKKESVRLMKTFVGAVVCQFGMAFGLYLLRWFY